MNKERRDSIRLIIQNIEDAASGLEEILEEEEQSRDNIPENLQNSTVYEKAEEACDGLSTEIDALNDSADNLRSLIGDY